MIERIFVIFLVAAAIIGMIFVVQKQRTQSCDGSCNGCPLSDGCSKPEKK